MAAPDLYYYVSRSRYLNVAQWQANTSYTTGQTVRPTTSTHRVFVCLIAGTSGASEPSWTTSFRATQVDNTVTWLEISGTPFFNGDSVNATSWADAKAYQSTTTATSMVICNNARTHVFATTNGNTSFGANEPTWNTTTGATTVEGGITWRCLGPFSTWGAWSNPMSYLAMAFNGIGWANNRNGTIVFVASDHYYSSASSLSINAQVSSLANPTYLLSVNPAGSMPPTAADLQVGAQEECTGSATAQGVAGGSMHVYGVRWTNSGSGLAYIQDRGNGLREACIFETTNGAKTGAGWQFDQSSLTFKNCTFRFAVVGESLGSLGAWFSWEGCTFCDTGAVPTNLFWANTGFVGRILNSDLSMFGAGKTLINPSSTLVVMQMTFEKCILHGSQVEILNDDIFVLRGNYIDLINCDTTGSNKHYQFKRITGAGTLETESTCVRTGGANDGTAAFSWKATIVSTASWLRSFLFPQIFLWNDSVDNPITVTVYGYWSGAAVPKNTDIEMNIRYFGESASPLGKVASNTALPIIDAMNPTQDAISHDADTSTWGAGGTTKFKMSLTFTPRKRGPLTVELKAYAPSAVFYIDPQPIIS